MSEPSEVLLEARQLACKRGRNLLFEGLELSLKAGSVTWLRGTNGSGKTSLMRILAGLSAPAAGEVLWRGTPMRKAGAEARDGLLYIGHANALKEDLTLAESVAYLGRLGGVEDADARAVKALDHVGLQSRRTAAVRTLSQGQRRRGALSRLALEEKARVWILDEPYDALDVGSTQTLSALITAQAARGGAVLLTSHQSVPLAGLVEFDLETVRRR
ncbi:heme exporter subunit; ATP-binding component of ABC superfamily [Rubrivivax sp. A210]|uniref:cytochrome c biogenesis heme-transporting ATPase CcmA n=1 Tax=Rubrivivax sp. A210 TaxID=2772301 RepID=UPI001917CAB8|nr:cytochrome c biogenesis heme-transporting ATPase CcmA [Rubrivivax sp. A210]CAD5374430.1 heme exporter subunit; ATP-binding component of ABC superfamily [Rubrivivax sp. A210]